MFCEHQQVSADAVTHCIGARVRRRYGKQIMNEDRIAKLTDGQRTCLRMVLLHKSSKDIGRSLGISHHSVDQRLRVAMKTLVVTSRLDAARCLAAHEAGGDNSAQLYQRSVYQPPEQTGPVEPSIAAPLVEQRGRRPQAALEQEPSTAPNPVAKGFSLPFPTSGRSANDLTATQRILWIVAIAFFAALSFGMVITGLETLSRVL